MPADEASLMDAPVSPKAPGSHRRAGRLGQMLWLIAAGAGALETWRTRFDMNPDGISYLDIADAYLRGDWHNAVNAYWSPLYSWILAAALRVAHPSPYWEAPLVHLVNLLVYLTALCCFSFMLRGLIRCHHRRDADLAATGQAALPDWACLTLGYALFLTCSIKWIGLGSVTPDMCVAAMVFLAIGLLIRIHLGHTGWATFALLGAVLSLGYLAKTAMFPVALLCLAVSALAPQPRSLLLRRALTATLVFLALSAPFVTAISMQKGRFTIGESGRLNYAFFVTGLTRGRLHPLHVLSDRPLTQEYSRPVAGTYPLHYDPSHWHEGRKGSFSVANQTTRLLSSVIVYARILLEDIPWLLVLLLSLALLHGLRLKHLTALTHQGHLLVPSSAALLMYALVLVHDRYVAPFLVVLGLALLSAISIAREGADRAATRSVLLTVVVMAGISVGYGRLAGAYRSVRDMAKTLGAAQHVEWQAARSLIALGCRPGDRIGFVGRPHEAYFARLARVRITASVELSADGSRFEDFGTYRPIGDLLTPDGKLRPRVIDAFSRAGVRAIVTKGLPEHLAQHGWRRLGTSNYHAYPVQRASRPVMPQPSPTSRRRSPHPSAQGAETL